MARELSQVDEPSAVLRLMGGAVAEHSGNKDALLLIGGPPQLCVTFGRDDAAQMANTNNLWYAAARACMDGEPDVVAPAGTWVLAVPKVRPIAVLVTEWPAATTTETTRQQAAALQTAFELTIATLGRIQVRSSLEELVNTQYAQIADNAQEHADELARRDLAACEMLALSLTDVLTGLNNRRGFFARAEPLFILAQRQRRASAVLYADIDELKSVNDSQGHAAGDQMIRDAATVLVASLRQADVLARLGGDEFVAYIMDDALPQALLSRLQHNLDEFNLSGKRPYQLSLSVGMVPCDPSGNATLGDLIQQADLAMYAQKHHRLH